MSDFITNAELRIEAERLCDENDQLKAENDKLQELLQRLLAEYRYMSVRPRRIYMRHEERMRATEEEMRELGVEVPD